MPTIDINRLHPFDLIQVMIHTVSPADVIPIKYPDDRLFLQAAIQVLTAPDASLCHFDSKVLMKAELNSFHFNTLQDARNAYEMFSSVFGGIYRPFEALKRAVGFIRVNDLPDDVLVAVSKCKHKVEDEPQSQQSVHKVECSSAKCTAMHRVEDMTLCYECKLGFCGGCVTACISENKIVVYCAKCLDTKQTNVTQ